MGSGCLPAGAATCNASSPPGAATAGHTFCYACITEHLSSAKNCPCCQRYLTKDLIYPNFLLSKVRRLLRVCGSWKAVGVARSSKCCCSKHWWLKGLGRTRGFAVAGAGFLLPSPTSRPRSRATPVAGCPEGAHSAAAGHLHL